MLRIADIGKWQDIVISRIQAKLSIQIRNRTDRRTLNHDIGPDNRYAIRIRNDTGDLFLLLLYGVFLQDRDVLTWYAVGQVRVFQQLIQHVGDLAILHLYIHLLTIIDILALIEKHELGLFLNLRDDIIERPVLYFYRNLSFLRIGIRRDMQYTQY